MEQGFLSALKEHMARYPLMEPQDYGKLIYQSEFGPEHFIKDRQSALSYLKKELEEISESSAPCIPEPIGGAFCRFPLSVCRAGQEAQELLTDLFVLTAQSRTGTMDGLMEKRKLLEEMEIPGMEQWMRSWQRAGCPAVHHSKRYKEAYRPHYRLLRRDYAAYFSPLLQISELLQKGKPILVGIDGRCGAGKTYFTEVIKRLYPCRVIHMDDFFLPMEKRRENWHKIPGGNMDFNRFQTEITQPLQQGKAVTYRPYDCGTGKMTAALQMEPQKLTVVEGSYSHHPSLKLTYDLKLFFTCAKDVRKKRLREREGSYFRMFEERWMPMEEMYLERFSIEEKSDMQIDTSGLFCEN